MAGEASEGGNAVGHQVPLVLDFMCAGVTRNLTVNINLYFFLFILFFFVATVVLGIASDGVAGKGSFSGRGAGGRRAGAERQFGGRVLAASSTQLQQRRQ